MEIVKVRRDHLVHEVIGAAIEVHRELGPGLLESAYQRCMTHEFASRGISYQSEYALPVMYKSKQVDCGYRIDLLVENSLIVELKSVSELSSVHEAQIMTYMKLANVSRGLLINFNVSLLKQGLKSFLRPTPTNTSPSPTLTSFPTR